MRDKKNITDRTQLKSFFKKGELPNESSFVKLIDSTFNIADDRLDIDDVDGLKVYPVNKGELLSFFESIDDEKAKWVILNSDKKGIVIKENHELNRENSSTGKKDPNPVLFLQNGGKIGIGTDTPSQKLDVKGVIASQGRMGSYYEAEMPADGAWHNVFEQNLDGCHAYEIMAFVKGKTGHGKYALMHAIAISTYGNSRPKISKTSAYFGNLWNNLNKIDIRWESKPSRILENTDDKEKSSKNSSLWSTIKSLLFEAKDPHNFNLQLKTKRNYGDGIKIYYKVSVLWDENFTGTSVTPKDSQ